MYKCQENDLVLSRFILFWGYGEVFWRFGRASWTLPAASQVGVSGLAHSPLGPRGGRCCVPVLALVGAPPRPSVITPKLFKISIFFILTLFFFNLKSRSVMACESELIFRNPFRKNLIVKFYPFYVLKMKNWISVFFFFCC